MHSIRLTARDLEIFKYMAKLRLLTMNQLATLFYEKHQLPKLALRKGCSAMRVRASKLINAGYIRSAPLSFVDVAFTKAYFLDSLGIEVVKDLREIESYERPRWLERRHTTCLMQGPHHVLVNNFLINLIMLSRCKEGFEVEDWLGDRDATFRFSYKRSRLTYDPDLYVSASVDLGKDRNDIFLEVDRNTTTTTEWRKKIFRFFQYLKSGKFQEITRSRLFPRCCILCPNKVRLNSIAKVIQSIKREYKIENCQFMLSTFHDIDIYSIDEGRITEKPLEYQWIDEQGFGHISPLVA